MGALSSHPTGVRGLKFESGKAQLTSARKSHPTGVRGLKSGSGTSFDTLGEGRTPLGCVD